MANEENLKPFTSDQNREEARKNGSKGGKASGEARRRKRAMRQAAAELLNMSVSKSNSEATKAIEQRLRAFGYDSENATFQDAMLVGVMMRALKGDVRASEFLRDTAGNNPALDIRKEELKLKKAELKLKQAASGKNAGEGVQIIDDIPIE